MNIILEEKKGYRKYFVIFEKSMKNRISRGPHSAKSNFWVKPTYFHLWNRTNSLYLIALDFDFVTVFPIKNYLKSKP